MSEQAAPDRIALLQRALDRTHTLIAGIAPEQHHLPTPCGEWDVEALVGHLVGGLPKFSAAARGEKADWSAPAPLLGEDWAPAFRAGADDLLAAWSSADAETLPRVDQQLAELCVHSWDVARATAQPADLDPQVTGQALAWSKGMLKPEYRGPGGRGAFGAEVPVPDDAPLEDRLAGWFGRDPQAWPAQH
jgi:uncharacterized protein (TIGR03086 family)